MTTQNDPTWFPVLIEFEHDPLPPPEADLHPTSDNGDRRGAFSPVRGIDSARPLIFPPHGGRGRVEDFAREANARWCEALKRMSYSFVREVPIS